MRKLYIHNGGVFDFGFELDSSYPIGATLEDSATMFVLLNEKQVFFYESNPNAFISEIWKTEKETIVVDKVKEARNKKIHEVLSYNNSKEVNSFIFQGQRLWVERDERVSFKTAVEAKIALGIEEVELPIKQLIGIKLNCQLVLKMLYMLENYCSMADAQMKKHLYALDKLTNVDEINNYDYKEGMPEIINFDNV